MPHCSNFGLLVCFSSALVVLDVVFGFCSLSSVLFRSLVVGFSLDGYGFGGLIVFVVFIRFPVSCAFLAVARCKYFLFHSPLLTS